MDSEKEMARVKVHLIKAGESGNGRVVLDTDEGVFAEGVDNEWALIGLQYEKARGVGEKAIKITG
jgi:hypothetical protein